VITNNTALRLVRCWNALLRGMCRVFGHDWTPWTYSENLEYGSKHRHHFCLWCGTSSGESGLASFPSGVWVEREEIEWTEVHGDWRRGRIVGIHRRLIP
jgi:hypothetical protein